MNKECAEGNDAPGICRQCAPQPVPRLNGRMHKSLPIDGNLIAFDGDGLPGQGHDGFDERCYPAITETCGKIKPFASQFDRRRICRRTDEQGVAHLNFAGERLDPPKSERKARCCVDPVSSEGSDRSNATHRHSGKRHDQQSPSPTLPPCLANHRVMPRSLERSFFKACA